jgi:hypothetical protein
MLVEQGKLRFVGEDRVQAIGTDHQFRSELEWSIGYGLFTLQPDGTYKINYDAATNPPPLPSLDPKPAATPGIPAPRKINLAKLDYQTYLQSEGWKQRRTEAVKRAGYRCQVCNSRESLEVHHRTYVNKGHELPEDLLVLCSSCHRRFHEGGRMPVQH